MELGIVDETHPPRNFFGAGDLETLALFENPHEFQLNRKNVREHMAFGRGVHSCPGGPLARVEGRVSIERLLDRMGDITVDAEKHGPVGDQNFNYEPTFVLRGLTELNINFTPLG